MYHSVALLLPDGRVVTVGGNPKQGTHVEWDNDLNPVFSSGSGPGGVPYVEKCS
jgi:hypothetical protein